MNKKTVLIIDEYLPYILNNINYPHGGASFQSFNWLVGFTKCGYDVKVLTSAALENRSKVEILWINKTNNQSGIFLWVSFFWRIFTELKQNPTEYLYVSIPDWKSFFYAIICKLLNIKFIQRISNNFMTDNRMKDYLGKTKYHLFRIGMRLSDIIVCQNSFQEENIVKSFRNNKIITLYNPMAIPDDLPVFSKGEYVAWVGIFQYQKNLKVLFKTANSLPDINFKIAGSPKEHVDNETKEYLKKLEKLDNVKFVGLLPRNEIYTFLNNSYCLLNTSRYEGFPNIFLEAMVVGIPIITFKNIDPDGIIKKNRIGFVVDNYNSMPDIIRSTIAQGKVSMKENGLQYLKLNHSPETIANKLLSALRDKNISH